jgi:membrane-associated phospholipid phosphatase
MSEVLNAAAIARSLARPYRVPLSLILLFSLVPLYIFIPALLPPTTRHAPQLALDRALPLIPAWAIVYGALYLFLILLPVFVLREDKLIRRTVRAYLLIWITAYVFFFVVYPTAAPRPEKVVGAGFAVWGLRALYSSDPPYNCFPSLHVAHSFVSALVCFHVHRRLGVIATVSATLVAVSTLFTKQHYVLDVVAGVLLAVVAYGIFLRGHSDPIPGFDRRIAPALALCVSVLVSVAVLGFWVAYLWSGEGAAGRIGGRSTDPSSISLALQLQAPVLAVQFPVSPEPTSVQVPVTDPPEIVPLAVTSPPGSSRAKLLLLTVPVSDDDALVASVNAPATVPSLLIATFHMPVASPSNVPQYTVTFAPVD